jgi:hypothetical protein
VTTKNTSTCTPGLVNRSLYKWAPVGDEEEDGLGSRAGTSGGGAAMDEDAEEQQRAALRELVRRATAHNYRSVQMLLDD